MKVRYSQLNYGEILNDNGIIEEEAYTYCKQVASEHWETPYSRRTGVNGQGAWHLRKQDKTNFLLELTYE